MFECIERREGKKIQQKIYLQALFQKTEFDINSNFFVKQNLTSNIKKIYNQKIAIARLHGHHFLTNRFFCGFHVPFVQWIIANFLENIGLFLFWIFTCQGFFSNELMTWSFHVGARSCSPCALRLSWWHSSGFSSLYWLYAEHVGGRLNARFFLWYKNNTK